MSWSNTPRKAGNGAYTDAEAASRVPLPKYQFLK